MKVPPMTLGKCPPGLFMFDGTLCFKSEYKTESQSRPGFWQSDAYVVESGEYFWGGVSDPRERERLEVTPIEDDERYAAGFAAVLAMLPDTAAAGTDARANHQFCANALTEGGRKEGGDNLVSKPILAIDFDGVIHGYQSGWRGANVIPDPPVPGAGAYLLRAVQHFRVAIFSSRSRSLRGRLAMKRYVRQLLWDACLADSAEMGRAWAATQGKPEEYIPWTAYDVRDVADHIGKSIEWPWFKPSALMTIDDRALTFNGDWSHPDYQVENIRAFKPWNKKTAPQTVV